MLLLPYFTGSRSASLIRLPRSAQTVPLRDNPLYKNISLAMSQTNAGHFFQTSESLDTIKRRTAKKSNKHGDPVILESKVLSILADHENGAVFVAEAAGNIQKINVGVRT